MVQYPKAARLVDAPLFSCASMWQMAGRGVQRRVKEVAQSEQFVLTDWHAAHIDMLCGSFSVIRMPGEGVSATPVPGDFMRGEG